MKNKLYLAMAATAIAGFAIAAGQPSKEKPQKFIFVQGEVCQPGRFIWTKAMTLTNAIGLAGGFTDFADPTRLEIRYPSGTTETNSYVGATNSPDKNPKIPSSVFINAPQRRERQ